MKKTNRFFISISILFVFLFMLIYVFESKADAVEDTNVTTSFYLSEQEVFEALAHILNDKKLTEQIATKTVKSPSGATIDSFDSKDYSIYTNENYGGMYIDDNGTLVVCFVENSNTLKKVTKTISESQDVLKPLSKSSGKILAENITIKSVKFSEEELLHAYEKVNFYMSNNDLVKTADVDPTKNRIVLGVTQTNDIKNIKESLADIEPMLDFEILDDTFEVKEIATINGTSEIHNNRYSSTPAGRLYSPSLNQYGIITCAHDWAINDNVYCDVLSIPIKIGTVTNHIYTSNNDSSFIILNSGHQYQDTKIDELSSNTPVVGSTITLRGFISKKVDSKVLSVNSSVSNFTGLIRCDKLMQDGDSGGGAIGGTIDNGRTACIVAINKAVSSTSTYLVKGQVICNAFG